MKKTKDLTQQSDFEKVVHDREVIHVEVHSNLARRNYVLRHVEVVLQMMQKVDTSLKRIASNRDQFQIVN